ncbi:MAG: hypothetical protein JJE22_19235, partial [Bacteroidia bacterium]|nr:hypothetical protein [Bacteroidia bacterium]
MEKSIETMWKEGFLKSDALVAPKVNDLYNQKSKSVIDKIMRRMKKYLVFFIVFAIGFLAYAFISGIAVLPGIFIFLLYAALAIHSKKQMTQIEKVDKNVSSYQYLKLVDRLIKEQISRNVKLSRFFYPATILAA